MQEETFESVRDDIQKENSLFEKQLEIQKRKWIEGLRYVDFEAPNKVKESFWTKITKIFSHE